jgi:hypothetical protein
MLRIEGVRRNVFVRKPECDGELRGRIVAVRFNSLVTETILPSCIAQVSGYQNKSLAMSLAAFSPPRQSLPLLGNV